MQETKAGKNAEVREMKWCSINKWLEVGNFIFMFDNWLNWIPQNQPTIREWTLFSIKYDNGAWWAFDLQESKEEKVADGKFYIKSGLINCFIEIVIFGIGFRWNFKRKRTLVLPSKETFKQFLQESTKSKGGV